MFWQILHINKLRLSLIFVEFLMNNDIIILTEPLHAYCSLTTRGPRRGLFLLSQKKLTTQPSQVISYKFYYFITDTTTAIAPTAMISPNTRPATMLTIADFTPTASILSSEILS